MAEACRWQGAPTCHGMGAHGDRGPANTLTHPGKLNSISEANWTSREQVQMTAPMGTKPGVTKGGVAQCHPHPRKQSGLGKGKGRHSGRSNPNACPYVQ